MADMKLKTRVPNKFKSDFPTQLNCLCGLATCLPAVRKTHIKIRMKESKDLYYLIGGNLVLII